MRREPGGTEVSHSYVSSLKYAGFSQLERGLGTAPKPLDWNIQRISLDSYPAKFLGCLLCERDLRLSLPSREFPNISIYCSLSISKEVTPIILSQLQPLYCPPQTSMSPYNLWKPLFSHFHTDNPYR